MLNDIARTKTANANVAATMLLESNAEFLLICRRPRKPSKLPAEKKPEQTVQIIRRSQLANLLAEHSEENFLVIPVAETHIRGVARPFPARGRWAWRTAWRKLTEQAGLKGLRPHDLRHHAITKLAESQASEQTITGNCWAC